MIKALYLDAHYLISDPQYSISDKRENIRKTCRRSAQYTGEQPPTAAGRYVPGMDVACAGDLQSGPRRKLTNGGQRGFGATEWRAGTSSTVFIFPYPYEWTNSRLSGQIIT